MHKQSYVFIDNDYNRTMNTATSFYIPRICKRWMPYQIVEIINKMFDKVIRVDIVPILREGDEPFLQRLNKEHHSAFVYFDKPIDFTHWSNGIKGGKQTRVYTGCNMVPVDNPYARPTPEYWVLIPNKPNGIIPFTNKTPDMLEAELNQIKELIYKINDLELFNKEIEIWEYDYNCVQFHKLLASDAPEEDLQPEFDKIYCAWVSIHQVASNISRLHERILNPKPIVEAFSTLKVI